LTGRILLAEDVPANQKVAQLMLKRFGLAADVANHGREALELWGQGEYDLILMDCQMPEMDGYEATGEIRRREETTHAGAHVAIVALTANALPGDRQKCLDCGMDDFLTKPFKAQELGEVLGRWLKLADAAQSGDTETNERRAMAVDSLPAPDLNKPSLDRATLARMRDDFGDAFGELLDVFVESTPDIIATLGHAIAEGDIAAARIHAHGLKSSSASYGAMRLAMLCQRLEDQAREGQLVDSQRQLSAIEDEYASVVELLERYRAEN
jgi:CheY-like chemotaxis protein/HPt (histidine-containing phosphotransfer) domain-containing protein